MKKNGGFTLVELIIVIAILAILSTGAIAGYSAYIKNANDAAVNSMLGDVYTSVVLANAKAGAIDTILVEEASDVWTVTVTAESFDEEDFVDNIKDTLGATATEQEDGSYKFTLNVKTNWESSKTYAGKNAKWDDGKWSAVAAATEEEE
jgi:prepilin-type N-terminal cleavage/methylation domain-containing protein